MDWESIGNDFRILYANVQAKYRKRKEKRSHVIKLHISLPK